MFSRSHRFHGQKSIARVYAAGTTVRGQSLSLKYQKRPAGKPHRVAVVVSKKVSKSAVTRNRIRRRVYGQLRELEGQIPPSTDLIFTVYSDTLADIDSQKLKHNISDLLQKTTR